ncbi:MAG: DUF945 family protein [Ectothiorhodospiraceae bacterium]|nr:DUF945 family protein [Ectothiorhodospiraceae bacterium]
MLVLIVLLVAVAMASPYLFGRQVERAYADFLRQLDGLEHVRVEQTHYRRGWFESAATYEVLLDDPLRRFVIQMADAPGDAQEPLRVRVRDQIRHGPLADGVAVAAISGTASTEGWLLDQLLVFPGAAPIQAYHARVGFDRVVQGDWKPLQLDMTSGPLLAEAGWEMDYSLTYDGGVFRYDLRRGEYVGQVRLARMRLQDPGGVTVSEGSTSDFRARFQGERLREFTVETHEPLTVREENIEDQVYTTHLRDQRTRLDLGFDHQGSMELIDLRYALERIQAESPLHDMAATSVQVEFAGKRNGDHTWFGGVTLALDALHLESRDTEMPGFTAGGLQGGVRFEPSPGDTVRMVTHVNAEDVIVQGLSEAASLEYRFGLEELQRPAYDQLWRTVYQVIEHVVDGDPESLPFFATDMSQSALALLGERPRLRVDPLRVALGDADGTLSLTVRAQPLELLMLGAQGLLLPDNELELHGSVAPGLLRKLLRVQLRQEFETAGIEPSEEELDAMAAQAVAEQLQQFVMQGILVRDGDRYTFRLLLDDGRLLLNGESADWLIQRF